MKGPGSTKLDYTRFVVTLPTMFLVHGCDCIKIIKAGESRVKDENSLQCSILNFVVCLGKGSIKKKIKKSIYM